MGLFWFAVPEGESIMSGEVHGSNQLELEANRKERK